MHFWDQHKPVMAYYESLTKAVWEKYHLRQMDYDNLMFLYNNPQYKTAADIVRLRRSTKSHVSTSLKALEAQGFIEKKPRFGNKKTVEIFLLAPAQDLVREGLQVQRQFMASLLEGLTPEEIKTFQEVFSKVCANAQRHLQDEKRGKQDV